MVTLAALSGPPPSDAGYDRVALAATAPDPGEPTAASDVARLVGFREELYRCLGGWADALFELCDAALGAPGPVHSVPQLSLEAIFRRSS